MLDVMWGKNSEPSKDSYAWILGTCKYVTLHGKHIYFVDGFKIKDFEMGRDNAGLLEWTQPNDINHYFINHYERGALFPAVIRKKEMCRPGHGKREATLLEERGHKPSWKT